MSDDGNFNGTTCIEKTLNDVRLILLEYGLKLSFDHKIKCNPDLKEIPENIHEYLGQNLKISRSFEFL